MIDSVKKIIIIDTLGFSNLFRIKYLKIESHKKFKTFSNLFKILNKLKPSPKLIIEIILLPKFNTNK